MIELSTPDDLSAGVGDFTFEGDLSRPPTAAALGEHAPLRQPLFGDAQDADCALCGQRCPGAVPLAAHIKKRAACADHDCGDLDNVAMAARVVGCDALFEAEYFPIVSEGLVLTAPVGDLHTGLVDRLTLLRGRRVPAHTAASAKYVAGHRDNIYRE